MRISNPEANVYFDISFYDIGVGIFIFMLIVLIGYSRSVTRRHSDTRYRYYFSGLLFKLLGSFVFLSVYIFHYKGGDTLDYYNGANVLKNLFYQNPAAYFNELINEPTWTSYFNTYNENTGWPPSSIFRSGRHFNTCKIYSILALVVPSSFIGLTLLSSFISYNASFALYRVFSKNFAHLEKQLRLAFLFLPSVAFWCSGIMKDTIVLIGVCYLVYETDRFMSLAGKKNRFRFFTRIIFWGWLIFLVKPYVVIAIAPALLAWLNYETIGRIKSPILKYYLLPFFVIGTFMLAFNLYINSFDKGEFAADNIMEKALVSRKDFATNITYGKNRAKVEVIDNPTSVNIIRAIPESIIMGMFRPFLWEARSPAILISSLENFFILTYFILTLFKLKLFGLLSFIRSHPLLLFSIMFTIVLAFVVGFTTPLFGAMVRFRTPFLPFLVAFMIVAIYHIRYLPKVRYK